MAAKILKFPRVPIPKPTIPHTTDKGDVAKVNEKVEIKHEIGEELLD